MISNLKSWISSTLCLCAFVTLCLLLSFGCSKPAQNDNENPARRSVKQKTSSKKPEKQAFTYSSHGKRDIFVPLVSKDKGIMSDETKGVATLKLPDLKVEGVLFGKDSTPFVIINDNILTIGDSVNGCKIISITTKEIALTYMNKEYKLEVSVDGISSKTISAPKKKSKNKRLKGKSFLPSARENAEMQRIKEEIRKAAVIKQSLEKQLTQTKEKLDEYKKSLSSEKERTADLISKHASQVETLQCNVSTLQSRIKALESDKTDLKKRLRKGLKKE